MSTETVTAPIGTALYKERRYHVLWLGSTAYGERAKLGFEKTPSETFWVDADLLRDVELDELPAPPLPAPRRDGKPRRREPLHRAPPPRREFGAGLEIGDAQPDAPADVPGYCASCGQRLA